jgi:hypothetical protein
MYLPAYTVRNIPASGKHQTALLGNAVPHGLVRVARLVNDEDSLRWVTRATGVSYEGGGL